MAPADGFDPDRGYALSSQVALRPERFGALAYDYGTRRLTFLKALSLVELVTALANHPTARAALDACVPADRRAAHERALAGLAASGVIHEVAQ